MLYLGFIILVFASYYGLNFAKTTIGWILCGAAIVGKIAVFYLMTGSDFGFTSFYAVLVIFLAGIAYRFRREE